MYTFQIFEIRNSLKQTSSKNKRTIKVPHTQRHTFQHIRASCLEMGRNKIPQICTICQRLLGSKFKRLVNLYKCHRIVAVVSVDGQHNDDNRPITQYHGHQLMRKTYNDFKISPSFINKVNVLSVILILLNSCHQ